MDANSDDTLDSEACAFLLHCEAKTVEEMARQGLIPGVKFGKSWVFFRDQLIDAAKAIALEEAEKRRAAPQPQATAVYVGLPTRKRRPPPVLPPLAEDDPS